MGKKKKSYKSVIVMPVLEIHSCSDTIKKKEVYKYILMICYVNFPLFPTVDFQNTEDKTLCYH